MEYVIVRNADVEVGSHRNSRNHHVASIKVNGKFEHHFDAQSRVSRALETMTTTDLAERFKGGTYFFVEGTLVDFRDVHYHGFIQDDASIASLVRVIGIRNKYDISTHLQDNLTTRRYVLGSSWDASQFTIAELAGQGTFENELLFGWSPFNKDVSSAFMLKQISTGNSIRGMSSFLRKKIPLINRWEEHLDIACKQLQVRIDSEVKRRFTAMTQERASIQELLLISEHAKTRIDKGQNMKGSAEEVRLSRIHKTANPIIHTNKIYKETVFTDMRLAAQRKGHLTVFDAYNLATEIRTHTQECEGSSTLALDRFANDLIFNHHDLTQYGARFEAPKAAVFKDTESAFFGKTE